MSKNNNDQKDTKLSGHNYDGIEELDNSLPKWWLNLFYICIAFAAVYFYYYQFGDGKNQIQEYELAKNEQEQKANADKKTVKAFSEAELTDLFKDPARRQAGAVIFASKCLACHGNLGQGGIGPNLTDKYWLHGGKASDIVRTITQGVADKGMPPWGTLLSADEVNSVASFVRSLQGTNPPGAKAPQGDASE